MRTRSRLIIAIIFSVFLLSPALVLAGGDDPIYDAPGFDSSRDPLSFSDFEHIDTYTGGLILTHEDVRIPGNGGLDLVIQRTFNSKLVCRAWVRTCVGQNCIDECPSGAEDSPVGIGWTMHLGKVMIPDNLAVYNPVIYMPDGSSNEAYLKPDGSARITKDHWLLTFENNTWVLRLTDGRKITFGHLNGSGSGYVLYHATQIEDANGNVIYIYYRSAADPKNVPGTIDYVRMNDGREVHFSYQEIAWKYRLMSITRPDGISIQYSYSQPQYEANVLLTQANLPVGSPWQYTYNTSTTLHDLTRVVTPSGGTIDYGYNISSIIYGAQQCGKNFRTLANRTASGRIPGGTWNFSYFQGTNSEDTIVTDPCGRTIRHKYYGYASGLSSGNMWRLGLPKSREIVGQQTITYDWSPSAIISNDDFMYNQVCLNSDSSIYVPYQSQQTITREGQTYTTSYSSYDSYGNPGTISESGDQTRPTNISYWYNTSKNIVKNKPQSQTVSGSLPGSFTTSYSYDSSTGNLTQINKYGITTNYTYYSNGNLNSEVDANGNTTSYEWSNGKISKISTPAYTINKSINTMGTIASEANGRGYTTSYSYDANLRLTQISPPAGNSTTYSYASDNSYKSETRGGFSTYYYYDGLGRLTSTQNSLGVVTNIGYRACGIKEYTTSNIGDTVHYDIFGRKSSATHQDSYYISYSYSGNNVVVTDETRSTNTTFYYNSFGNPDEKWLVQVTDGYSNTANYSYNMLGSLTGISQSGINRGFSYDSRNFLTSETHPEKGTISYGRDSVGNMTSKTDALGSVSYSYDGVYRLTGINYGTGTIGFSYDGANNRTSMNNNSASISYSYDPSNRQTTKNETISGRNYTTNYSYDGNDNITNINYPSGRTVNYSYNSNNQVTSITGFGGSITNINYCGSGSCIGLPQSYTTSNGLTTNLSYSNRNLTTGIQVGTSALNIAYGYDSKGNLTSMTDNLDTSKNMSLSYDSLNRLLTFNANGMWGTGSLTYDSIGNRTAKTVMGISTTYNYSNNRLTSATGGEPVTVNYNGYGDATSLNGDVLTYDRLHNVTSYKRNDVSLADFTYDGDGMRIIKTAGSNTTVYHYDQGSKLITENKTNGMLISDYIYLHGKLIAKINAAPTISVSPATKDFGNVNIAASVPQVFTVSNTGTDYLVISSAAVTGDAAFTKNADNCTGMSIDPNASCTIEITFNPGSIGIKNATLSILSNDPTSPTKNVALSGTGMASLTITNSGNGTGTVTSSPTGIACGTDCSEDYSTATTVILTATPDACSDFIGWNGGGCSGTGTCIITVNTNIAVEAVFNYKPLTAGFNTSTDNGTAPFAVTMTDQSFYCPSAWNWNFGDGTTSAMQNPPVHIYRNAGNYTASLTVTNLVGAYSTATKTINVQTCSNPTIKIGSSSYSSLQAAYDAAVDGDVIKVQAVSLAENLNINRDITITLEGGYNCDCTNTIENTYLIGMVTISAGQITMKNFVLSSESIGPTTTASPQSGIYSATSVTLTCSAGSGGSGCDKIYYTTDGSTPTTSSTVYAGPINIPVTTTLKYFAKDLAGNSETVKTQIYTIDTQVPTGTISINNGSTSTNNINVTLSLTCTDQNGCSQMQFSNDNITWSEAEAFSVTKAWALTNGEEQKTVYVKFGDSVGNWSNSYSAVILFETTAPTTTASPSGEDYNTAQSVTLACDDGSVGSGCDKIYYTTDGTTPTTSSTVYVELINISVTTTLKYFAKDLAGNSEEVKTQIYTITANGSNIININGQDFTSLQAAYNAANEGDTIKVQAVTIAENLNINRNVAVTIDGGYNSDYSIKVGDTMLKGMIQTFSNSGTITIGNFIISN